MTGQVGQVGQIGLRTITVKPFGSDTGEYVITIEASWVDGIGRLQHSDHQYLIDLKLGVCNADDPGTSVECMKAVDSFLTKELEKAKGVN